MKNHRLKLPFLKVGKVRHCFNMTDLQLCVAGQKVSPCRVDISTRHVPDTVHPPVQCLNAYVTLLH